MKIFSLKKFVNSPVFIIGQYRSGTTIIKNSIGSHKSVYLNAFESPALNDLGKVAYKYKNLDFYRTSTLIGEKRFKRKIRLLMFESYIGDLYSLRKELGKLRRFNFSIFNCKKWVASVSPTEKQYLGLIYIYPALKSIYIYRNGIEQVNSCMNHASFNHDSFQNHCIYWVNYINKFKYLEGFENNLLIRQTELLEKPEFTFRRIMEFLNLDFDNSCVEFCKNNVIHPLGEHSLKDTNAKQYFNQRGSAWYKWSSLQKKKFRAICGEKMKEYGFEIPDE
jgi:hypothetical protein